MADQEYEILPHQLLADLKYDVEALKKKLTTPDSKSNELILEIESMKDSVHELNMVFEKALKKSNDTDVDQILKSIDSGMKKIVLQNETIAKGMIAISDKLEDFMNKQQPPAQLMPAGPPSMPGMQHTMGPPTRLRTAPRPEEMEMPSVSVDLPPPPPEGKKKRTGLFR
jgi:hypothetical protein